MFALELLEGELAAELPAHMRAFARAYVEGRPPPPAPEIATRASTLALLRSAPLALARLVVPLVIESDAAVVAAGREPVSWPGLAKLATARDAVARARFGCRAIELLHRLSGVASADRAIGSDGAAVADAIGPIVEGWHERGEPVDVDATWVRVASRFAVRGHVRIERSDRAHPRAFVVEPLREVIVVVPRVIDTPAGRFALLHELGHAVVALALPAGVPRVVDEAAAAYVARDVDWAAATKRRIAIAATLDAIERQLPDVADRPSEKPPWALWHDPGAQATYIEAEAIADRLTDAAFVQLLQVARARIDASTALW